MVGAAQLAEFVQARDDQKKPAGMLPTGRSWTVGTECGGRSAATTEGHKAAEAEQGEG